MDERQQEIGEIRHEYPHFYSLTLASILIGIFILIGGQLFISEITSYNVNLWTSLLSFALTVFILDRLNEIRATKRQKADLIYKMSSSIRGEAIRASEELKRFHWLSDGSMKGAHLWFADLSKTDLTYYPFPDLSEVDFDHVNFQETMLGSVNFQRSMIKTTNLNGAALDEANFSDTMLSNCYLNNAYLSKAVFRRSHINRTKLLKTSAENVDFFRTYFDSCDLSDTNLKGSQLQFATLYDCKLHNTDLSDCDLTGCDFFEADLSNCRVTEEQLGKVGRLWGATMPNGHRYDGFLHLNGDIAWAASYGVNTDNLADLNTWYANGPSYPRGFRAAIDMINEVRWGRDNLPRIFGFEDISAINSKFSYKLLMKQKL